MTKRILHPLFHLLGSLTQQELARQVFYLKEENKVLRERLPDRISTTETERKRLIRAGKKLGPQLKDLMSIVTYQSFRRWIREIEAEREKAVEEKSTNHVEVKNENGRPKTPDEVRELILKIKNETGYGYTKIRQELAKLGIKVSRQTVKNILVAAGLHDDPNTGKDSWDAFLKRHADTIWQCDYMSKPMWTSKGIIDLFMIVFIHIGTRRIWVSPSTANPNSKWLEQQGRNFLMHAEDVGLSPELLMHDRDTKFTNEFDEIIKSTGCEIKQTPIRSPNLQAHVERVVQTLKHEVLNEFVVVSEKHLNHICRVAQDWYNNERGHSARENLPPGWSEHPEEVQTIKLKDVACSTRLGGLLKHYWRRAA